MLCRPCEEWIDSSVELLARIDRERLLHEIAHNDFGTTRNVGSTEAAWRIFDACDSGESCDDEDQPDV